MRKNKYNARKTEYDGQIFASKLEARCYKELIILQSIGEISDVKSQVRFDFVVNDKKIGWWKVDFTFTTKSGSKIARDAKGVITRDMPIRKKLAEALYPEWTFEYWPIKKRKK